MNAEVDGRSARGRPSRAWASGRNSTPPGDFQRLVFLDRVHISIHESACLQLNHRWVSVAAHVKVGGALLVLSQNFTVTRNINSHIFFNSYSRNANYIPK